MHFSGTTLVLLLLALLPWPIARLFQLTGRFSPSLRWVNSLDSTEKLAAYLSSDYRMARQTVTSVKNGTQLVMGINGNFTVKQCLRDFLAVNSTHFLLLHIKNKSDFRLAYLLLDRYNSPRLGVLANVEKGPNCKCAHDVPENYVGRSTVGRYLVVWPPRVRLVFGYTSMAGPINQYSKWQMEWMFQTVGHFHKRQPAQYVIEYDAMFLSHKFNLLGNVEAIKQHQWLVVIHCANLTYAIDVEALRRVIYYLGPRNVYLNMPREMRQMLAIEDRGDPETGKGSKGLGMSHPWFLIVAAILEIKNR